MNLARVQIDPRVLSLLPQSLVVQHKAVPIAFCNNRLTLAMTNPNNIVAFDDVRRILKGVLIEPVAVTEDDLRRFMGTTYAQLAAKPDASTPRPAGKSPPTVPGAVANANTAASSISCNPTSCVNCSLPPTLTRAPMENDVTIRFRIDGVLQVMQRLSKRVQLGLISRLKILSRLDISEKRLPQDGRISVTMEGKPGVQGALRSRTGDVRVLRLAGKDHGVSSTGLRRVRRQGAERTGRHLYSALLLAGGLTTVDEVTSVVSIES